MHTLRYLFAAFAIGLLTSSHAAEPCSSHMPEYPSQVDKIIDDAVGRPARLSITTIPSFRAESGVRLVGSEVYFVKFASSVWRTSNADGVGPKVEFSKIRVESETYKAALRTDLADRLEAVYAQAISQARPSHNQGLDGVTHHFSIARVGCAEVWSPDRDTPDGQLVMLAELLEKHAQLEDSAQLIASEKAIERAAKCRRSVQMSDEQAR